MLLLLCWMCYYYYYYKNIKILFDSKYYWV